MSIKIGLNPLNGRDSSDDSKNTGSARALTGEIFVLSIFVSPPNSKWTTAEVNDMKARLEIAELWLKKQAAEYGKLVIFENGYFGSDGNLVDANIPQMATPDAYFYGQKLVEAVGFGSPQKFMSWVENNRNCSQCLVIVFPHCSGRSFACPTTKPLQRSYPNQFTLETCIVFQRFYDNNPVSAPGVIAHEMLHLFGAWDLYELNEMDRTRANTISRMYPNSIMRSSHGDINDCIIDEINAWLVGLRELKKEWYRWFEPDRDEYITGE